MSSKTELFLRISNLHPGLSGLLAHLPIKRISARAGFTFATDLPRILVYQRRLLVAVR